MQQIIKHIYLFIFLLLLIFPTIGLYHPLQEYDSCERRRLHELPEFELTSQFATDFEAYFKDHFSYRNLINHWDAFIKYAVFGSSPKPQESIVGADDWFYYTSLVDHAIKSYSHENLFNPQQLQQHLQAWEDRKSQLGKSGIAYYMAVYPAKSTIYTDNIPNRMQILQKKSISKIDQILMALEKRNSPLQLLDVRTTLLAAKDDRQIYCKHDTHWNAYGAFLAYRQLMEHIGITPYSLEDFDIKWESTSEGDLINIMGLCNSREITEMTPLFTLKEQPPQLSISEYESDRMFCKTNASIQSDQKILIFRDSYTKAMVQFIELHFKESYFVWAGYNQEIVDRLKPDIVVVAKAERYL